jgi:AbrB family looped-hinge helix DNA binding protein
MYAIERRSMDTVTVSSKYQIVIPQNVREPMGIRPGQKVRVMRYEDRIEVIPVRPIEEMRGFLKGIDTTVEREADRV